MMSDFGNTNRGSIWRNERKETDTHPDFTGTLDVEGTEYWVSAWKRKPGANPKAPSLTFSIKRKEQRPASNEGFRDKTDAGEDDFDDPDIPF